MKVAATLVLALRAAQPLADASTAVLVKLARAASARAAPGAGARSGLQVLDAVVAPRGATELRRVFRTDPRHAARHAAFGLDRCYLVTLPVLGDVTAATVTSGAHGQVEAAEANAVVRIPGSPVPAPEPPVASSLRAWHSRKHRTSDLNTLL